METDPRVPGGRGVVTQCISKEDIKRVVTMRGGLQQVPMRRRIKDRELLRTEEDKK